MTAPLHRQAPTTRFTERAADYVKYRPGYPPEAIDAILADISGTGFQPVTADIGAGTGISSRLLADRGVRVLAIEPNEAMRAAAAPHERIEWRPGTAESTGLPDRSVDLVLCAQSYHWFDVEPACREFARILRHGGRLALMWNDADERDPVARGYYDLVRAASTGVGPTSHQTVAKAPRLAPPFDPARLRRLRFPNTQRLGADGLIGRAMSASYVPKTGEKAERLLAGLRALHRNHADADGLVALVYEVHLYLLDLTP